MKKYILIITAALALNGFNSCSDRDLELLPPEGDLIEAINSQDKLQQILNGAYLSITSSGALGSNLMLFGDLLGDKIYNTPSRALFLMTYDYNYNGNQNQFGFYSTMYNVIMSCNMVINNTEVPNSTELTKMKGQAKILRGIAYYYLVSYYSPTPTSGVNQDYGVPLVLGDYDVTIQPERATVAEIYNQIISDLTDGMQHTDNPAKRVYLGPDAAKIVLARTLLTRRAAGDAQLALQYATQVMNNSPAGAFNKAGGSYDATLYANYFKGTDDTIYEGHDETIWELDLNFNNNAVTGIGSNGCLPVYYSPGDNTRRGILANATFFNSFGSHIDIRRGGTATSPNTGLFSNQALVNDTPNGYWVQKYPRTTSTGNFFRNIRVFRYSEANLLRIEALRLTGQEAVALTELNAFATSRKGTTYTGTDLLNDILTEKSKEFYGEGQRFLDLKRYNLPVSRPSNCNTCDIAANDHRFVLPISQGAINSNPNLKQYPGYVN